MKKYLIIAMVLLTWIVYLKSGEEICAKKISTGRFGWVVITPCDGKDTDEIYVPREYVEKIVKQ
jgi:hypothetical protein